MNRNQKPREKELTPTAPRRPDEDTPRMRLRIEELEIRLAPQSTSPILE
jgi:hypothetical protein